MEKKESELIYFPELSHLGYLRHFGVRRFLKAVLIRIFVLPSLPIPQKDEY